MRVLSGHAYLAIEMDCRRGMTATQPCSRVTSGRGVLISMVEGTPQPCAGELPGVLNLPPGQC